MMFDWNVGNAAGTLYHNSQIPCGVLIHGGVYHLLEDWPPFVALVEHGEIGVDDSLLFEIARHLRERLFGGDFGANQTVHAGDLHKVSRDARLPLFLAGEAGDDLLRLLGFGFRAQFRGVDLNYLDGLGCRNVRTIACPVVPEGLSRASVALLPEEINLVSKDAVLWGHTLAPVQAKTSRPLRQAEIAPLAVNLVNAITVGELELPYLYLEPGSEIQVNGVRTPIVNRPVLLLARKGQSMLEVFLALAANPLLLEGILANLYARDLDIWDAFMNAVPTEQYGAGFEFDPELCAIALLCHAGGSEEEKAFIALLSNWLHETSLIASYEIREEEDLTCHLPGCEHRRAETCIEGARHALMAFLLDPGTAGLLTLDYTHYFQVPIEWRSERQKEVVDGAQSIPAPA